MPTDAELALEMLRRIAGDDVDSEIMTETSTAHNDGRGMFLIDSSWINCSADELDLLKRLRAPALFTAADVGETWPPPGHPLHQTIPAGTTIVSVTEPELPDHVVLKGMTIAMLQDLRRGDPQIKGTVAGEPHSIRSAQLRDGDDYPVIVVEWRDCVRGPR